MGARPSKRSVNITKPSDTEGGEVATEKLGKLDDNIAVVDPPSPKHNGDTKHIEELSEKEKQLNSETPENEKDLSTEKEIILSAAVVSAETPAAIENGHEDSNETPAEPQAACELNESKNEPDEKKKKDKVKKKWSFRSISFSKKDKQKPSKKQEENGECEKVPEEAVDDAVAPAQTPTVEEAKPVTETPIENKPAEPIAEVVAPTEEPEAKITGEPETKKEDPKPEEEKVPEPVAEPVIEIKKEEAVAAAPVKESEAPIVADEKVEEKPATPVEEKPATPIVEETKIVEEPAVKPEPEPVPEPEPEVVEVSAPVPEPDQKDEPKEVCEVVPPLPATLPPSQVSVFAESTMASETTSPQKPIESSEIPVHIPQLNSEASPLPIESSTVESISAVSLENTPLSSTSTKEITSAEETFSKTIQNVEIPIDVVVVPVSVDVTKKIECASPLPVKLDDKIPSSTETEIVEPIAKEIKEIVDAVLTTAVETSSVSEKPEPSEVSSVTSDLSKVSLADIPLSRAEPKDSVTPPSTPVELQSNAPLFAPAPAPVDEKLIDSLEHIDAKTDDISLPPPPAEEKLTDSLEKIDSSVSEKEQVLPPPEEQLTDSLEKVDESVPLVDKEKAPEDQLAPITELISESLKVEKTESSPAHVDAEANKEPVALSETLQVINDNIEVETKTEISKVLDDLPLPPSNISITEDILPPPPAALASSLESQPYDSLEASIPLPSSTEIENSTKEVLSDNSCTLNHALIESPQAAVLELAASLTHTETLESACAINVESSPESSSQVPKDITHPETLSPPFSELSKSEPTESIPSDTIDSIQSESDINISHPSESAIVAPTPPPSDVESSIPKSEIENLTKTEVDKVIPPLQEAAINPEEIVSVANVPELTAKPSLTNLESEEVVKPNVKGKTDLSKPSSLHVIKVADLTLDDSSEVNLNSSETNAPETSNLPLPEIASNANQDVTTINTEDLPQLEPTALPEALPEPYLSASISGASNQVVEVGGGEKIADVSATESVQDAEPIAAPVSEPAAAPAPVPAPSAEAESVLTQDTPPIEIPTQDTSLAVADQ